jgi:hypothetical protein
MVPLSLGRNHSKSWVGDSGGVLSILTWTYPGFVEC